MILSRKHLENEYLQKLALSSSSATQPKPLSTEQREASLQATLANAPANGEIWLFGYGSLIWNPLFTVEQRETATLFGFKRSFCLKSELGRGSPGTPGLVLALEPGGSCSGVALKMCSKASVLEEFRLLWKREMVTGAYKPLWVELKSDTRSIQGLAFVMNRDYPYYEGNMSLEETAKMIAVASGPLGSNAEYLHKTHVGLAELGISDTYIDDLAQRVQDIN